MAVVLALVAALLPSMALVAQGGAADGGFAPLPVAARLVDTRPGQSTIDGRLSGIGRRPGGSVLRVGVRGRVALPPATATVVVNVTVTGPVERGYVAVFPCGSPTPGTSNQNYVPGDTRAVLAVSALSADGRICVYVHGATHLIVDLAGSFGDAVRTLPEPARLLETRAGLPTVDGRQAGGGRRAAGSTTRVQVAGRGAVPRDARIALVGVTVVDPSQRGFAHVRTCGAAVGVASTVNFDRPGRRIANVAAVPLDGDGGVCVFVHRNTHLLVDVFGWASPDAIRALGAPRRLVDTRPGAKTFDGALAGIGLRPGRGTLTVPVAGRDGVPADAGAVLLNVTAIDARTRGFVAVHAGGTDRPIASNLNARVGETIANAVVSPLGSDGEVCLYTHGSMDVVVDVVAWLPSAPRSGAAGCPATPLFPAFRIVALYGNDVDARLGVLGEQPPRQAADRLGRIAAPYAAGDRPVRGAFELIATIATRGPGSSGLYRSPSSAAHVQRYLDVATAEGLELILDIQPGRGDFLTELRRYDAFLRRPNVHAALDPEWNVGPNQVPGQVVGQVDATEVNRVADYLSRIVAEEGLPEKMLVVHQFQDRMLTRRELLREPAGVAVTIHMDGFGTQAQKLATYGVVKADPPLSNGFKLFFDEDIDRFTPAEVLALDPVPDLVSYQ